MLRLAGWSANGDWLAYWESSQEDVASQIEPWPPASLSFYNPHTAEICPHPHLSSREALYLGEWTAAGEAVVKIGEEFYAVPPCGGRPYQRLPDFQLIAGSQSPRGSPAPDPALSPGGEYRAVTTLQENQGGVLSFATRLTLTSPESSGSCPHISGAWQIDERLGDYTAFLGGEWISPSQFLIHETLDQGPLILDAAGCRVAPVLAELFAQQQIPSMLGAEGYNLHAAAIPARHAGDYHLLLYGVGQEGNIPPARLYHAENGEVETLPYRYPYSAGILYGADGKAWLLMDSRPTVDSYETHAVYFRQPDDSGAGWRLLGDQVGGILWNSTVSQAAIISGAGLEWLEFPSLEQRGSWITRPYVAYPAAFSPSGCWLAAVGSRPGEAESGLFVLPGCPAQ
jgi:hypothetical protein